MKEFTESNWQGWNPSAGDKRIGQGPLQLLKMNNLTLDENGIIRSIVPFNREVFDVFAQSDIYNLYSAILNGIKVRFAYGNQGLVNKAFICTTTNPRHFSTTLIAQAEPSQRSAFLNVLGQIIFIAGAIQRKYDGTNNFPLSIPAPAAPTIVSNATNKVDLNNLDGANKYSNWSSVTSASFDSSGIIILGTGAAAPSKIANVLSFQTTFTTEIDTTNLGGTGNDTPEDIFTFNFEIDDVTQLSWVRIELYCAVTPNPANYFWKEWAFGNPLNVVDNPYAPFSISSNIITPVQLLRKDFFRLGDDPAKGWKTIKQIRVEIGISGISSATWYGFDVKGGTKSILTGSFNYVAVQVNNTGNFIEFSPASPPVSITASAGNFTITAAAAVDSQCNEYWLFRQDPEGGNYYFVAKQLGARGFTPTTYLDYNELNILINAANINSQYTLQYYRQLLPTTIVDMIWFRDRVIYLTNNGFIPSFNLDPGSYDFRYVYEICGANSEKTLFIVKLDVNTFIIATTADFYRVTGTFAIQTDPLDPTGEIQFQDVSIITLGISDPAISRAFVEYQGTIIYVSATGIRVLANATSSLINGNLDLLFRGESRYELSPFQLLPFDQSIIAAASQGNRVYWSLPHKDGINRLYVLNIIGQTGYTWRLISIDEFGSNPRSLCKENDGTLLAGGNASNSNYILGIENDFNYHTEVPIKFRTQFNYGDNPMVRKDALNFKMKINTNGRSANLVILALLYDGSITSTTIQFSSYSDTILDIDLREQIIDKIKVGLPAAVAYSIEIGCITNIFRLEWFTLYYEERPVPLRRVILYNNNMDSAGRKRIAQWSFIADPLGLLSNTPTTISAYVSADGIPLPVQQFTGAAIPQTFKWECDPTQDILATDWSLELIGNEEFELHKLLPPVITQHTPELIFQIIFPANNFKSANRKRIGVWQFRANLRGSTIVIIVRVDNITLPTLILTDIDFIDTYSYYPPDDTIGVDWEMEINVITGIGMEFYEFIEPTVTELKPNIIHNIIFPATNFGKGNLKKIAVWPFIVNSMGHPVSIVVTVDKIVQDIQIVNSGQDIITTLFWFNNLDIYGVDWQMELYCDGGMEFYKFLTPDIQQIFPLARMIDQIGPLDLNAQGLIYGMRLRIMSLGNIHYKLYENDYLVFESDIIVDMRDQTYIEKFPQAINPSVARLVITASQVFYRFSLEYHVRLTGKETEGSYIMIRDVDANPK